MARFTAANARENAAKAHASRRQRLASGNSAAETFPQTPQAGPHEATNDYVSRRLARLRTQLNSVDTAIEREVAKSSPDGQRLNWLAQAQDRLAEQERLLAGRPLPGSRRPREERTPAPVVEIAPLYPIKAAPVPVSRPAGWEYDDPNATPTPRSAPGVEPVPIEVALRHRPAPLSTPASPTPPTPRTVVTTATVAMMPTVSPNPRPPG